MRLINTTSGARSTTIHSDLRTHQDHRLSVCIVRERRTLWVLDTPVCSYWSTISKGLIEIVSDKFPPATHPERRLHVQLMGMARAEETGHE